MKKIIRLSSREREIMDIVFERGEATLTQVLDALVDPPTRAALRSLLTILEDKGHLTHHKDGREFIYRPVQSRQKVGRFNLTRVVRTFFEGSLSRAVASYLSDPHARLTEKEIHELAAFVEEARAKTGAASQSKPN